MIKIRALAKDNYDAWLPLWEENCLYQITEEVTRETWGRICEQSSPVKGLGVFAEKQLQGILHYVLHPTTGSLKNACYMQDLFIAPAHRRQGLATQLVLELADMGRKNGWSRLYWLAEGKNEAAQEFYKTLGIKLDFTLHILPTQ